MCGEKSRENIVT